MNPTKSGGGAAGMAVLPSVYVGIAAAMVY
jgi:hypothetical protein